MIDDKKLNKLKEMACDYMDGLSEVRNAEFNAGQARGIQLMFEWIKYLESMND